MIVVLTRSSGLTGLQRVIDTVEKHGLSAQTAESGSRKVVTISGYSEASDLLSELTRLESVEKVVPVGLTHKETTALNTSGRHDSGIDGKDSFAVFAGPCSIENEEQMLALAGQLKKAGATAFRGGLFKPRTSPYSFQGLGEAGLKTLERIRHETGLKIITEALGVDHLEQVAETADFIQIGSRNMQNTPLLKEAGKTDKPVMLKRGMAATLDEWLNAAEYVAAEGNSNIILCERGIRTFTDYSRFTLDLSVIPAIRERCGYPVIIDPSHGTGKSSYVASMCRAALAAGADGLMVEVHPHPEESISDPGQAISPAAFKEMMADLRKMAAVLQLSI